MTLADSYQSAFQQIGTDVGTLQKEIQYTSFDRLDDLLNTPYDYTKLSAGDIVHCHLEGFSFQVQPLGAQVVHRTTSSGVLLKALPTGNTFYPEQFGAKGDAYEGNSNPSNDSPAFAAMVAEIERLSDGKYSQTNDDVRASTEGFSSPFVVEGKAGSIYGVTESVVVTVRFMFNSFENVAFKAIGNTWAADEPILKPAGGFGGNIRVYNCQFWCNRKSSGIQTMGYWHVDDCHIQNMAFGGYGLRLSNVKARVSNIYIAEWDVFETEFYDPANYGAKGVWLEGIDHHFDGGSIQFCDVLVYDDTKAEGDQHASGSVNTRFIGTHFVNTSGKFQEYNIDGTTREANPNGTPCPGRDDPIGLLKEKPPTIGGYAPIFFVKCYMDCVRHDLYDDAGVHFIDCDWTDQDHLSNSNQKEWIRNYANEPNAPNRLVISNAQPGIDSLPKKLVVWLPHPVTGDTWENQEGLDAWSDSPENLMYGRNNIRHVSGEQNHFITGPFGFKLSSPWSTASFSIRDRDTSGWGGYGIDNDQLVMSSPSGTARFVDNLNGRVEVKIREGSIELRQRGSPPSAPVDGQFYYDTSLDSFRFREGVQWRSFSDTSYASRADLVAACADGTRWPTGTVISVGTGKQNLAFIAEEGTNFFPDLPGLVAGLPARPEHWTDNVDPGATDMTAAWQQMMNAHRTVVPISQQSYHVTAPIVSAQFHQSVVGFDGTAYVYASHTLGPVFQFRDGSFKMEGIRIDASGARLTAPYDIRSPGVMVLDDDWQNAGSDPEANAAFGLIYQCRIENHPGSGILSMAGLTSIRHNAIKNCRGHGIHHEPGPGYDPSLTAINLGFPGMVEIAYNKMSNCDGHALLVNGAGPQDLAYRMQIHNNDGILGATNPAILLADRQCYIAGENIFMSTNGWNDKGIFITGQQITSLHDRFPSISKTSVGEIKNANGYTCRDIRIIGADVNGPTGAITYAWELDADHNPEFNEIVIEQVGKATETHILSPADRARVLSYRYGAEQVFNGDTDYANGSLAVSGNPVHGTASGSFTAEARFQTPGDFVPSYVLDSGYYRLMGDMAFIHLRFQFSDASNSGTGYSTAAGLFFVDLIGLPFDLDSAGADRTHVPLSRVENISQPANNADAGSARAVTNDTLMFETSVKDGGAHAWDTTNIVANRDNMAFIISGWFKTL